MLTGYIKKLYEKLIENDFKPLGLFEPPSKQNLDESGIITLARTESPVFYAVNIVNTLKTDIQETADNLNKKKGAVLAMAEAYRCSRVICLNIAVCDNSIEQEINSLELTDGGDRFYSVWWAASPSKKTLTAADGHPTDILNIKKLAVSAYGEAVENDSRSAEEIIITAIKKSGIKAKSSSLLLTLTLILLNIAVFVSINVMGNQNEVIHSFGCSQIAIINMKQYYRLITSMFLHINVSHIAFNCLSLYIFGSRTEIYYGKAEMAAIFLLSGIGGDIMSVTFSPDLSVGASGAIFGLMGAVLALSIKNGGKAVSGLQYSTLLLFTLSGTLVGFLTPSVNNLAHIGGLICGFMYGMLFYEKPSEDKNGQAV